MPKKKSTRLLPILEIEKVRERQAIQLMNEANQTLKAHHAKLMELKSFHADYVNSLENTASHGISITRLNEYKKFIANLEVVIRQQQQNVDACYVNWQEKSNEWHDKRKRQSVLSKAVTSLQEKENKKQRQIDQKNQDELSHNKF